MDYEELYILLYNMQNSKDMTEVSNKLYWSISKTSKKIKEYEEILDTKLYIKNDNHILSEQGIEISEIIRRPLEELKSILIKEEVIGIDENLIEDEINIEGKIKYMNSSKLINQYNLGELDKIIISSDYEKEIVFTNKKFIKQKAVYFIKNKTSNINTLYASEVGCPITQKLQNNNFKIDEYLTQSTGLCQVVRKGIGVGYTFSTKTLDENKILIENKEDFKVKFNLYTK